MSIKTNLIEMTESCVTCGAVERFGIRLTTTKADAERADEYCLSCACALATQIERLLREAPIS